MDFLREEQRVRESIQQQKKELVVNGRIIKKVKIGQFNQFVEDAPHFETFHSSKSRYNRSNVFSQSPVTRQNEHLRQRDRQNRTIQSMNFTSMEIERMPSGEVREYVKNLRA